MDLSPAALSSNEDASTGDAPRVCEEVVTDVILAAKRSLPPAASVRDEMATLLNDSSVENTVKQGFVTLFSKERAPEQLAVVDALLKAFEFSPHIASAETLTSLRPYEHVGEAAFIYALTDYDLPLAEMVVRRFASRSPAEAVELEKRLEQFCMRSLFAEDSSLKTLLAREARDENKTRETAILKGALRPFLAIYDESLHCGLLGSLRRALHRRLYDPKREFADLTDSKLTPEQADFLQKLLSASNSSVHMKWIFSSLTRRQQIDELLKYFERGAQLSESDYYLFIKQLPRGEEWGLRGGFPKMMADMSKRGCGSWGGGAWESTDRYLIWHALRSLKTVSDPARLRASLQDLYAILHEAKKFETGMKEEYQIDVKKLYHLMIEEIAARSERDRA